MLYDECGVIVPGLLPYSTVLVPGAATFAATARLTGPKVVAARDKIKRWFWCSVFGQAYEKASNSQAAKDFAELKRWLDGGREPQTVEEFDFDAEELKQVTTHQRAIYRGVMALILRHGARDFHTGEQITAKLVREERIDDHHVFPKQYIAENLPEVSATLRIVS